MFNGVFFSIILTKEQIFLKSRNLICTVFISCVQHYNVSGRDSPFVSSQLQALLIKKRTMNFDHHTADLRTITLYQEYYAYKIS